MLERDEVPKQILVTSSFIRPAMFAFPAKVVLQDSAGRDDAARPSDPSGSAHAFKSACKCASGAANRPRVAEHVQAPWSRLDRSEALFYCLFHRKNAGRSA